MPRFVIESPYSPAGEIPRDLRAWDRPRAPGGHLEDPAPAITKAASKQTYYTIRLFVDRERTLDAFRAYAYFRWVDDRLDEGIVSRPERLEFVARQRFLVAACYCDACPADLSAEERMLADLVQGDRESTSGLRSYISNMMAVMAFDAERRGRLISGSDLSRYTDHLATAVTAALHHFIGHGQFAPAGATRNSAAAAAHVTHMLRDTFEDVASGYFNVPAEFLEAHGITPWDIESVPYREWVESRVRAARASFKIGEAYLARVEHPRCRLAGRAYMARFRPVLDAIEREGFQLRPEYRDCKGLRGSFRASWSMFAGLAGLRPRSRLAAP